MHRQCTVKRYKDCDVSRSRWIWVILLGLLGLAAIYMTSNPELSSRYVQAQREAALSADTKEIVMIVIAAAIAAYFAWFFLIRRD
jgi:hypothetical protein